MPPISTLIGLLEPSGRATGTVPTTGEGGMPPPVKTPERSPPQMEPVPITPEALNRFTAYPRASPRLVAQVPGTVGSGRLVLKKMVPPKITDEVTVCSPAPALSSMYHPRWPAAITELQSVSDVKLVIEAPSRSRSVEVRSSIAM